jgi:hypothetical protein
MNQVNIFILMKHEFSKTQFELYDAKTLESWLKPIGYNLRKPQELAQAIMKLSDIYTSGRGSPDVWVQPSNVAAYLTYFMPLNYMRCQYALDRTSADIFSPTAVDYGAGLGAFSLALLARPEIKKIIVYEPSGTALDWSRRILKSIENTDVEFNFVSSANELKALEKNEPKKLSYFLSYSLNEMTSFEELPTNIESIIIVEPSTQSAGRALQNYRAQLLRTGFNAWAPCLHQDECPLLKHSKTDWCHTRFHLEMPDWFMQIEKYLPIKNQSITLSYLSASRRPPPSAPENHFRIIGDTQFERGKTKQGICRNSQREFFSWLTKNGEAPMLPRGETVEVTSALLVKGDELRPETDFNYNLIRSHK